ncbi:MAG: DUF2336 domain-containing protein [Devosiaceae bacterium]|nr:DUF2336 domain-containing protein [Devosiaceae bacterium]
MIGFQPYETFQLLIETGGMDRANTLLVAACDAFARRGKPHEPEIEQFEVLAERLFPTADTIARIKAASTLGRSEFLSPKLEQLVVANIGDDLNSYLSDAPTISEETMIGIISTADTRVCAILANRTDISNIALAKLFQLNSRRVYRALSANPTIRPRGPYLNALARSAQMDHKVAQSLAKRKDFDTALLAPAFFDLEEVDRLRVIDAFSLRKTPDAPIKRTLEQISLAKGDLARALMKLFMENRRPEVTRLLTQITGMDEVRCGQIAHDVSGAALFVILRAFGMTSQDGLKVIIHATSHEDEDRSQTLGTFATMFQNISSDAMAFLLSAWRDEVNLLDLAKPKYRPFTQETKRVPASTRIISKDPVITQAVDALERIGARRAS